LKPIRRTVRVRFCAAFTAFVVCCALMAADSVLDDLDELRWERRVLVVFAAAPDAPRLEQALRGAEDALADRDMSWFLVVDRGVTASNHPGPLVPEFAPYLARRLGPEPPFPDVLLIGLDGGLKAREPALDLQALFERVDGMPMRRRELEARSGSESEAEADRP